MRASPHPSSLVTSPPPSTVDRLAAEGVRPDDEPAAQLVEHWLRTYAATRDPHLRERIILVYLGLADRVASRYVHSHGATLEDLRQVARVGLVAAVDRYNPARASSFVPYAVACVVGELKRYLRDATWTVRVARPLKELGLAACRAMDDLSGRLGRAPTVQELAEHLGASPQEVLEATDAVGTRFLVSLDQPVGADGQTTFAELLADAGPREQPEDLLMLPELVKQLPDQERLVIRLTYVDELTQSQIAAEIGCSQMQVSRLLRRALDRLRRQLLPTAGEPTAGEPTAAPPIADQPPSRSRCAPRPSRTAGGRPHGPERRRNMRRSGPRAAARPPSPSRTRQLRRVAAPPTASLAGLNVLLVGGRSRRPPCARREQARPGAPGCRPQASRGAWPALARPPPSVRP